jgi:hypothetical protein
MSLSQTKGKETQQDTEEEGTHIKKTIIESAKLSKH